MNCPTCDHTPGPWTVQRRWSNECEIIPRITCAPDADRGCGWIADLIGAPYLDHKSTLPNAYLIAAAPDLLAALEWIATEDMLDPEKLVAEMRRIANEAIAKAVQQ